MQTKKTAYELPPELLLAVFEHLCLSFCPRIPHFGEHGSDSLSRPPHFYLDSHVFGAIDVVDGSASLHRRTLSAAQRVCRAWVHPARQVLYSIVSLNTLNQFRAFARTLDTRPEFAHLVQALFVPQFHTGYRYSIGVAEPNQGIRWVDTSVYRVRQALGKILERCSHVPVLGIPWTSSPSRFLYIAPSYGHLRHVRSLTLRDSFYSGELRLPPDCVFTAVTELTLTKTRIDPSTFVLASHFPNVEIARFHNVIFMADLPCESLRHIELMRCHYHDNDGEEAATMCGPIVDGQVLETLSIDEPSKRELGTITAGLSALQCLHIPFIVLLGQTLDIPPGIKKLVVSFPEDEDLAPSTSTEYEVTQLSTFIDWNSALFPHLVKIHLNLFPFHSQDPKYIRSAVRAFQDICIQKGIQLQVDEYILLDRRVSFRHSRRKKHYIVRTAKQVLIYIDEVLDISITRARSSLRRVASFTRPESNVDCDVAFVRMEVS